MTRLGVVFSNKINELYKAPGRVPGGYWGDPVNTEERGNPTEYMQGIYYALLEGRFAFDFVHENDLTPEGLKKYNALILPNVALLSNQQVTNLEDFVKKGGSLLATFETGLYDEWGKPRSESALANLFDIQLKPGYKAPKGQVFYTRVNDQHEIFNEFKGCSNFRAESFMFRLLHPANMCWILCHHFLMAFLKWFTLIPVKK
jgi:hypothetical protein